MLLIIAIFNDVFAYLYITFIWHDSSEFLSETAEIFAFALAGYLAYKDHPGCDFISCFLALESLRTIYLATPHLYSLAWLKTGPQVLFSNILMTILFIVSIIHFLLLIIRKPHNKRMRA